MFMGKMFEKSYTAADIKTSSFSRLHLFSLSGLELRAVEKWWTRRQAYAMPKKISKSYGELFIIRKLDFQRALVEEKWR